MSLVAEVSGLLETPWMVGGVEVETKDGTYAARPDGAPP